MKKLMVNAIIVVFCILFYKNADAAVVFGMNGNTAINNIITATIQDTGEEIQIKNMVSVQEGQAFNLSQVSNQEEISGQGNIINIEILDSIEGLPEEYNYNPYAVSVDNYNIKVNGTGMAVLKVISYPDAADISDVQNITYMAVSYTHLTLPTIYSV